MIKVTKDSNFEELANLPLGTAFTLVGILFEEANQRFSIYQHSIAQLPQGHPELAGNIGTCYLQ